MGHNFGDFIVTTIAWDGRVLAGDTLANGLFRRKVDKIFTIKSGVYFGGCGYVEDCMAVVQWLQYQEKDKPKLEDNFAGILIENNKVYRLESKLIKLPIKEKHHAVGSGATQAMVAMFLGQGAVKAIQTASIFDSDTSFETTFVTIANLVIA